MDTEDMVDVMHAFMWGDDIEARRKTDSEDAWLVVARPTWDWEHNEYRVKED